MSKPMRHMFAIVGRSIEHVFGGHIALPVAGIDAVEDRPPGRAQGVAHDGEAAQRWPAHRSYLR